MTPEPVPLTRRLGLGLALCLVREEVRIEEEEVLSLCRMGEASRDEFAELCRVPGAERLSGVDIRGTRDIEGGFWRGAARVSGSEPFPLRPVLGSVEVAEALARFDFADDLGVGVDPLEEAMASHRGTAKEKEACESDHAKGWVIMRTRTSRVKKRYGRPHQTGQENLGVRRRPKWAVCFFFLSVRR